MRNFTLMVALACGLVVRVAADDIVLADGNVLLDAKVITIDVSYVIVKHDGRVRTFHAADLHPGTAQTLGLRELTPEEKAARDAAAAKHGAMVAARMVAIDKAEAEARQVGAKIQAERAVAPKSAARVVTEQCSVVYHPRPTRLSSPGITRIQGRVLARVHGGAIVQGDGLPSGETFGDFGWVQGTCFIQQSGHLNATTGGSPITARVFPAGEYRYTDSQGVVHVLRAWRL